MLAANRLVRYSLLLGGLVLVDCGIALADEGDEPLDRTPKDCLQLQRVRRTEAIDDENIVFYMRGNTAFLNHLPQKCPGLARQDRFTYTVTIARLCNIDTITVLEQWGVELRPGFTCRLGQFVPVTTDEVADLKASRKEGGRRRAIDAEAVKLPPEKADASGTSGASPEQPPAAEDPH